MKWKLLTSAWLPEIGMVWISCVLLILPQGLYSQKSAAIDSLMNVIALSKEDTGKVNLFVNISKEFLVGNDFALSRK